MSTCLKQRGFALVCTNVKGSLHVPVALEQTNKLTLSFLLFPTVFESLSYEVIFFEITNS